MWDAGEVAATCVHAVSCHLHVLCVLPTCHCALCVPSVCSVPTPCFPGGCGVTLACLPTVLVTRALHTQCTLKGKFPAWCGSSLESHQPGTGTLGQAPLPWACLPGAHPFGIAARECAQNHTRVCKARAWAHTHIHTHDHVSFFACTHVHPSVPPMFPPQDQGSASPPHLLGAGSSRNIPPRYPRSGATALVEEPHWPQAVLAAHRQPLRAP